MEKLSLLILAILVVVLVFAFILAKDLLVPRAGRLFLVFALCLMPLASMFTGVATNLEASTQTEFCASCHEMGPYVKSLSIDDREILPAYHYQNRLVPRDQACFTCHRDYAMFGDVTTKLNGLKHVYRHFVGPIPKDFKLYKPFSNQNCLHCHEGARSFMESKKHQTENAPLDAIRSGQVSCGDKGCHDAGHAIKDLPDAQFWKGAL